MSTLAFLAIDPDRASLLLVLALVLAGVAVSLRAGWRHRAAPYVAAAAVTAIAGQFLLLDGQGVLPLALLLATLVLVWLALRRDKAALDEQVWRPLRRQEGGLLACILAVATVLRVWRLGDYPRGVEQDEATWTWMLGQIFHGYLPYDAITKANFDQMPVGFYEKHYVLGLLGQTMFAARVDVMVSSLLALVALYFLFRVLTNPTFALIALALVATSTMDVASSRLAMVEAQTKLWVALSYLTLVLAIRPRVMARASSGEAAASFGAGHVGAHGRALLQDAIATYGKTDAEEGGQPRLEGQGLGMSDEAASAAGGSAAWRGERSLLLGLACGCCMAIGMSTYLTFNMTPVVVALTLIVFFLREALPKARLWLAGRGAEALRALRDCFGFWFGMAFATGLPLLSVVDDMIALQDRQRGFNSENWLAWTERHPYDGALELAQTALGYAAHNLHLLLETLFWSQRYEDFFLVRQGHPVVLAAELALFVVGLAFVLARWRQGLNLFVLIWLVVQGALAAVGTGYVLARVMLPGLPALHLIAAVGLYQVWAALSLRSQPDVMESRPYTRPSLAHTAPLLAVLLLIGALSSYVYFELNSDPIERLERREMIDYVTAAAERAPMAVLAHTPGIGDRLKSEEMGVRFTVGAVRGQDQSLQHYRLVPYERVLGTISGAPDDLVALVWRHGLTDRAFREEAVEVVKRCYPDTEVRRGDYYELVVVSKLVQQRCYGLDADAVRLKGQFDRARLSFDVEKLAPNQTFRVVLESLPPGLVRLEAEDSFSGHLWYADPRFGPGFTGSGLLIDTINGGPAQATVQIPAPGPRTLWLRLYYRDLTDAREFVLVDGVETALAKPERSMTHRWLWLKAGIYDLTQGVHTLALGRHYATDPQGIFFDAVILSLDSGFDPNQGEWQVVGVSDERRPGDPVVVTPADGLCEACPAGSILTDGAYRWRVQVFDGDHLVSPDGTRGAWSDYSQFEVRNGR